MEFSSAAKKRQVENDSREQFSKSAGEGAQNPPFGLQSPMQFRQEESEDGVDEWIASWRRGEVWFREYLPQSVPWGDETFLDPVPDHVEGSFGARVGSATRIDGKDYGSGEIVVMDTELEFRQHLPNLASVTDLAFPGYGRLVPTSLLAPNRSTIDLTSYRRDLSGRFLKSLLLTAGLVGLGFAYPDLLMIALIIATLYGLFPLVESGMAWMRRVDRLSVGELNRRLVNFEFFRRWLLTKRPRMLQVGIGVLAAVFLAQILAGLRPSFEAAALVKERVLVDGEWWRIVTTGLMHGNVVHILFNGMALYSLGRVLAALVSPSLLSFVFLFTVVTGSLASLWLGPGATSVGASGGILGCLGFLLVITGKFQKELPGFLRTSLIQSTLVVSIFGLLGSAFIDNAAHAGGFLGGVVLGMAFSPWMRLAPTGTRPVVRTLSAFSLAILLAGVGKVAWELWRVASP